MSVSLSLSQGTSGEAAAVAAQIATAESRRRLTKLSEQLGLLDAPASSDERGVVALSGRALSALSDEANTSTTVLVDNAGKAMATAPTTSDTGVMQSANGQAVSTNQANYVEHFGGEEGLCTRAHTARDARPPSPLDAARAAHHIAAQNMRSAAHHAAEGRARLSQENRRLQPRR